MANIKEILNIIRPICELSPKERETLPDITKRRILKLNFLILGILIGSEVKTKTMKKIINQLKYKSNT